jgi:hypothetical protein
MTKKKEGFVEFPGLDPAIDAIVNKGVQRTDGRGQAGHAGKKGTDKRGVSKKTIPLPLSAQRLIEEMAREENVPQGDIVAAAVQLLYQARSQERVDLDEFKTITYSEKQPWRSTTKLDIPTEFDFFSGETQP